ncbi:ribonuclease H-like domain-containing protein [Tanacetum coccineum]
MNRCLPLPKLEENTISKSSSEAEYRALAYVTSEVIWVLKVLKDLGYDNLLPVSLFCDSKPAIKIAANPVSHERTKHLEIDLHFEIENYHVWSNAMLLALKGRNKTSFIDGSCRRSNVDVVLGRQWDRVNAVVLGWILNSITEELFPEWITLVDYFHSLNGFGVKQSMIA